MRRAVSLSGRSLHLSPFLYDFTITAATSVATVLALVLVARILAERLSPDGFGAVMLARRVIATLDPLSTFAMVVAVTRFAAIDGPQRGQSVLFAGALLALSGGAAFFVVAIIFAGPLAGVIFGGPEYAGLVRAAGFAIVTYSAFIVLYAWYRGTDRMTAANLWQLWAIAIGPVLVAWLFVTRGGEATFIGGSGAVLGTALVPLAWELKRVPRTRPLVNRVVLGRLVSYAAPRVPSTAAFGVLLAAGPLLAPHLASLTAVGYLAAGHALLRLVEATTEGFGRVALAKIAQLYAAGQQALLSDRVADITAVAIHIGSFATCQLWVWTPAIVSGWLGEQYVPGIATVRLVVVGLLPYLMFVTLRSVLDAVEERAVNAKNLYVSVAVTVAGSLALGAALEAEGLALASTVGLTALGVRTTMAVRQRYPFGWADIMVPQVLAINAVLFVVAVVVQSGRPATTLAPLAVAAVSTLTLGVIYLVALRLLGARWIDEIGRRVHVVSSL